MQASPDIQTPEAYLASLPEPRQSMLRTLHAAICQAAPHLTPHINYGMLAYGPYRYQYASGREGDGAVVSLASQKQYISLYLGCDGSLEKHKERLGKVSMGRCCIRFKKLEDLNLAAALELIRQAVPTDEKK
jgi:hypothetical protein